MLNRAPGAASMVVLAVALAGCAGDAERVVPETNAKAFATADAFILAVERGVWQQACSQLTLEAQIEVAASIQRRDNRSLRPSCVDALSGPTFAELCRALWKQTNSATTIYRDWDVVSKKSEPKAVWFAAIRRGRLTPRCEMRLVRGAGKKSKWRVDAIALKRSQAVLTTRRDDLVFRNAVPVKELDGRLR